MYPALRIPMQNTHLSAPYSTAITDSLDSQVAPAPLRIQFAGVTPVPLPPPIQGALWVLGNSGNVSLWQQRRENHTTGLRPEENKPTALSGDRNAPLLPTAPPPEGEVLAPLCLEMLMSSEAESRANFSLRGKYRRRRHIYSSPSGDTTPSEPSEPSEPFEPSRRRRVQWRYHHC